MGSAGRVTGLTVLSSRARPCSEAETLVIGVGIDLVETWRAARALERWGDRLVQRLMDAEEGAALPAEPAARGAALADAIALKEATSKALGTGWSRGVRWRDVVVGLREGRPDVRLRARAAEVAQGLAGPAARIEARLERRGDLVLGLARLVA